MATEATNLRLVGHDQDLSVQEKVEAGRLAWHDHYLIVQEKGQEGKEDQVYVIPYGSLAQYKRTGELAEALRGRSLIKDFFSDEHMRVYAANVEAVLTKTETQNDGASVAELLE